MIREEGHYTIKRVKKLPKRGNSNFLYILQGAVENYHRWGSGGYETIPVGGGTSGSQTALETSFDNTVSGLTAVNVQSAIDEVASSGGSGTPSATKKAVYRVSDFVLVSAGSSNYRLTHNLGISTYVKMTLIENQIGSLIFQDVDQSLFEYIFFTAGTVDLQANTLEVAGREDFPDLPNRLVLIEYI